MKRNQSADTQPKRKSKTNYINESVTFENFVASKTYKILMRENFDMNKSTILKTLMFGLVSDNLIIQEYCERCFLWIMNKEWDKNIEWSGISQILKANPLFFNSTFQFIHQKSFATILYENYKKRRSDTKYGIFTTGPMDILPQIYDRVALNEQANIILDSSKLIKRTATARQLPNFNSIIIDDVKK